MCLGSLTDAHAHIPTKKNIKITGEKIKLKIGSESMRMLHSIRTLILLATVPAMTFIPGRMLKSFEAVGAGTSATVYKATYAGATVALKRLSASFSDSQQVVYESMIAEIQLLTQLRHPNVVNFLGICYNSKSVSREQEDDVDVDSLQIDLVMDFYPLCLKNFLYVEFTCGSWRIVYHMCTPFIHDYFLHSFTCSFCDSLEFTQSLTQLMLKTQRTRTQIRKQVQEEVVCGTFHEYCGWYHQRSFLFAFCEPDTS